MKAGYALFLLTALPLAAQVQADAPSTFVFSSKGDERTIAITNVVYDVATVFSREHPDGLRFALRNTTSTQEVIGDKGVEGKITLEAWPLGVDLKRPPLYSLKLKGTQASVLGGALWQVEDSTDPDVALWSVYQAHTGRRLFESLVKPLSFMVSMDPALKTFDDRFAGLEVPPDDAKDVRLREKHVIAVLSYASRDRLIREALLTCDDVARAQDLRSYWDTTRTVTFADQTAALQIRFAPNVAADGKAAVVTVPIVKDDLNLAKAVVPVGFRITAWKR